MFLLYLKVFLTFIVSGVFWVVNAELFAAAAGVSGDERFNGWLLALALGSAQTVCFVLVYYFGNTLMRWSTRLRCKVQNFDMERFENCTAITLVLGSIFGLPPLVVLAIIAGTVKYSIRRYILIVFSCRCLRFAILYFFAQTIIDFFGWDIQGAMTLPF